MKFYQYAITCLFFVGISSSHAQLDEYQKVDAVKGEQLAQILQTKGDWFDIKEGVYLGMPQSKLLAIDEDARALIEDGSNYPKVLVSRQHNHRGISVIYGFSEAAPTLDSVVITRQLTQDQNQREILTDTVRSFGKPSNYQTEVQQGSSMAVLIWNKANFDIAVSYVPDVPSDSSSIVIMRVISKDIPLKSILKNTDRQPSFDMSDEKTFIESLSASDR